MPSTFVLAFVPGVTPAKWVDTWKKRVPLTSIDVRPSSAVQALAAIVDGSANVALIRMPVSAENVSVIPLYEEQPVVVVPSDHPISAFDTLTRAELEGEVILEGQDAGTVELVAAGLGVALMPQSLARLHSRKDVVARQLSDVPTTRIALVWRTDDESSEVEQFIGIVRGRTANSSRGELPPPVEKLQKVPARKAQPSSRKTPSSARGKRQSPKPRRRRLR